jgi:hypothetical protein
VARYNLGCILARAGRRDEAVEQLRTAVQHGLPRDAIGALPLDADLASLRGHPGFEKLLAEGKAAGTPR